MESKAVTMNSRFQCYKVYHPYKSWVKGQVNECSATYFYNRTTDGVVGGIDAIE